MKGVAGASTKRVSIDDATISGSEGRLLSINGGRFCA